MGRRALTTEEDILQMLEHSRTAPVSGERMSQILGITRTTISSSVERLRRAGYHIISKPHVGHQLLDQSDSLLPSDLLYGMPTSWAGRRVFHFDTLNSTQTKAQTLSSDEAPNGTLVVSETQTAGRGRRGKHYESPRGGIWCTLITRRAMPIESAGLLGLAAGIALATTIKSLFQIPATLKWPNDVMVGNRKLAGILVDISAEDNIIQNTFIGLGLNANVSVSELPSHLRHSTTSLSDFLSRHVDRRAIVQKYLVEIEGLIATLSTPDGPATITDAWISLPNMLGSRVQCRSWAGEDIEGVAVDIGRDGSLVIEIAETERLLFNGGSVQVLTTAERAFS